MSHPILVIADIHGNLEALKAVMNDSTGEFGEIWVVGDLAGYGPDPGACIDLLRKRQAVVVAGNHDWAACGKLSTENFNAEAKAAVLIHQTILSEKQKIFLEDLPETLILRSVTLAHGNPEYPIWGYVLDNPTATRVLSKATTSLTLVGHTHLPALWVFDSQGGARPVPIEYGKEISYAGRPHLANPGSVGQSRDGEISARYMILHPERKILSFRKCTWKRNVTRKKMKKRGYPETLIDRMAPE